MVSEKQRQIIDKRIMLVAKTILKKPAPISEISKKTGFPTSTIQRDLTSARLVELLGADVRDQIKTILKENIREGKERGALVSHERNTALKDKKGKFMGCRKMKKSKKNVTGKVR